MAVQSEITTVVEEAAKQYQEEQKKWSYFDALQVAHPVPNETDSPDGR